MKKISGEKIQKVRELRETGLSVREVGKRLNMAPATVFRYAQDVSVDPHNRVDPKIMAAIRKTGLADIEVARVSDYSDDRLVFICLPYTIICPHCGKEADHIGFCVDCEGLYCFGNDGSDGCGKNIDLRTAQRKEEAQIK